jgi:hypothetical protein
MHTSKFIKTTCSIYASRTKTYSLGFKLTKIEVGYIGEIKHFEFEKPYNIPYYLIKFCNVPPTGNTYWAKITENMFETVY